jgi:hypothetical protein
MFILSTNIKQVSVNKYVQFFQEGCAPHAIISVVNVMLMEAHSIAETVLPAAPNITPLRRPS